MTSQHTLEVEPATPENQEQEEEEKTPAERVIERRIQNYEPLAPLSNRV